MCEHEISRTFPLESGGVLMGAYVSTDIWYVDQIIGPGPRAKHARCRFSPDLDFQAREIAHRFHDTSGRSTYLGDWHSHPDAMHGRLSSVDKEALKEIASAPAAKCPVPLMMILWGRPDQWMRSLWHARYVQTRFLPRRFKINACRLIMLEGVTVPTVELPPYREVPHSERGRLG